ncbi:MAG: hypothetical protein WB586_22120 [Chthoniobacterales bacterium]
MYRIEAIVTTATPTELKLTGNYPLVWLQALGPTALGSTEIERQLLPDEAFDSLGEPVEQKEILGNRGNWPNLQRGDRVIVRCYFPGESR